MSVIKSEPSQTWTEYLYQNLPSMETYLGFAVTAGAGFAVGGPLGAGVALGSRYLIRAPLSSVSHSSLGYIQENFFNEKIQKRSDFSFTFNVLNIAGDAVIIGVTSSQGKLVGTLAAAAGIVGGVNAASLIGKVLKCYNIENTIGGRVIKFSAGVIVGFFTARYFVKSISCMQAKTENENTKNKTLSITDHRHQQKVNFAKSLESNAPLDIKLQIAPESGSSPFTCSDGVCARAPINTEVYVQIEKKRKEKEKDKKQ
ncbi:hypothetical protein D5R81_06335 [Parashewanella spongiae]|uniref:Uncharacterized protein n=2 Tax=Parashewanella spongiae TaxID=342950 RepID=A0A3A6TV82_9GAMM|nr:hypothetical protein D5R81_06335 [Parashewanella spongiae]